MRQDYFLTHYSQYIGDEFTYLRNQAGVYRRQFFKKLQEHKCFPDIKVLDICCGVGDFCYFLQEIGCTDVTGIDSSMESIKFCKSNFFNYKFYHADAFEFLEQNTDQYDVVSMFSCLEHFKKDDIVSILFQVKTILNLEGLFLLSTPNMDCLFSNTSGRYGDFTHEVGFTRSSLEQVLKEAGFKTITIFGTKRSSSNIFQFLFYKIYQPAALKVLSILFRSLSLKFPEIYDYVLWATVQ